ncbi:LOW QUALITY PROTEIN: hypothetical protein HID58_066812 [Brassica napus]|uniref:Uncharacterized protein n=1 Tax=Brassica napus TaxID=3708 RepID=A0ABQ7ZH01_BRANA|nr:LOW QUALITY PROTEIN: hypothetical protein HID58_066812 [Brassica napus]
MLLSIDYRFQRHHIFTAKNGEDEHGDLKTTFISAAKEVFFSVTKLPQSKEVWEKKVYLIIKEFSPPADKNPNTYTVGIVSDKFCKKNIFLRWLRYHDRCILLRLCCKMISFIGFTLYIDIYKNKRKKKNLQGVRILRVAKRIKH